MHRDSKTADSAPAELLLDEAAIDAAKKHTDEGVVTPTYGPWRQDILRLLNDALATELTCVLRYRRHHFMANGLESPTIAEEFLVHANAELGHADRIAQRIVQLGGEPDFNPVGLLERGHAGYDEINDLKGMIKSNLIAERIAVESYRQMIGLIADKDSTTRRLLEDILADEEEHADELKDWMTRA